MFDLILEYLKTHDIYGRLKRTWRRPLPGYFRTHDLTGHVRETLHATSLRRKFSPRTRFVAIGIALMMLISAGWMFDTAIRGGNGTFSGTVTIGGPHPWIDVTAPQYGAKCNDNGSGNGTDDTAAVQAAINALINADVKGSVVIPDGRSCRISGQLSFTGSVGVQLHGGAVSGSCVGEEGVDCPGLIFTGSTTPFLQFAGAQSPDVEGLLLLSTNNAATGCLAATDGGAQSNGLTWKNVGAGGNSNTTNLAAVLCLDQAINVHVSFSTFNNAKVGIRGAASNSSFSNAVSVKHSQFNSAGTANLQIAIQNATQSWQIDDSNDFEVGTGNGMQILAWTGGTWSGTSGIGGINFSSNWIGDGAVANNQTLFNFPTGSNFQISGNTIATSSTSITMFSIGNNSEGGIRDNLLVGTGNQVGTLLALGTGDSISFQNLILGTVSGFRTGTPQSGYIWDNSSPPNFDQWANGVNIQHWDGSSMTLNYSNLLLFGGSVLAGVDSNHIAFFQGIKVGESTLSGQASYTVCAEDPTNHDLRCSYNNGSTLRMPQVIASGTASMTTALIASGACGSTVTVTATGAATTDVIEIANNASVSTPNGLLVINKWPTSGNVNFNYCNPTAAGQTPGAATLNWAVKR